MVFYETLFLQITLNIIVMMIKIKCWYLHIGTSYDFFSYYNHVPIRNEKNDIVGRIEICSFFLILSINSNLF